MVVQIREAAGKMLEPSQDETTRVSDVFTIYYCGKNGQGIVKHGHKSCGVNFIKKTQYDPTSKFSLVVNAHLNNRRTNEHRETIYTKTAGKHKGGALQHIYLLVIKLVLKSRSGFQLHSGNVSHSVLLLFKMVIYGKTLFRKFFSLLGNHL